MKRQNQKINYQIPGKPWVANLGFVAASKKGHPRLPIHSMINYEQHKQSIYQGIHLFR